MQIVAALAAWTLTGMAVVSVMLHRNGHTIGGVLKESSEKFADDFPEEEREGVRQWQKDHRVLDVGISWFWILFMAMLWPVLVLAVFL